MSVIQDGLKIWLAPQRVHELMPGWRLEALSFAYGFSRILFNFVYFWIFVCQAIYKVAPKDYQSIILQNAVLRTISLTRSVILFFHSR